MNNSLKTIVFYFGLCVIFLSCKDNTGKEVLCESEDVIDKIIIQFHPAFHDHSLMLLDFSTKEQTFQRMGQKIYYQVIPPREVIKVCAPISMSFRIDSLSYSFLRDSISFNEEDFTDQKRACSDGIFHTMLYVFNSGRIEDADLVNSLTESQRKLIMKLIDLSITQTTDSLTKKYLEDLKRYHD